MGGGFNFSAAGLAIFWSKWNRSIAALPLVFRWPAKMLGLSLYAIFFAIIQTMPFSGILMSLLALIYGARAFTWAMRHLSWIFVFWQIPARIRPSLWVGVLCMVVLEGFSLVVLDSWRGWQVLLAL